MKQSEKKPKAKRLWALPKKQVDKAAEARKQAEAALLEAWLNSRDREPQEVEEDEWL